MDRIPPIGPPGPDPQPVEPVTRRQDDGDRPKAPPDRERRKRRPAPAPRDPVPPDEDDGSHVDVRA